MSILKKAHQKDELISQRNILETKIFRVFTEETYALYPRIIGAF